jgi:hypothetical protein
MTNFLFIALILAMLATLGALVAGIVVMTKGGDLNKRYGQKLMRLRVFLQGLALVLFALALLSGGNHENLGAD